MPASFFSNLSDCITCPKSPSFLLIVVCCSVSYSSIPISIRTLSLVFFPVHDTLFIFLHILISHSMIFLSIFFAIVHVSQPYRTVGKVSVLTILFVSMLTCLSGHNFSNPIIVAFPIATLRFVSFFLLPSFSLLLLETSSLLLLTRRVARKISDGFWIGG